MVEFYTQPSVAKEVIETIITCHNVCGRYRPMKEERIPIAAISKKKFTKGRLLISSRIVSTCEVARFHFFVRERVGHFVL